MIAMVRAQEREISRNSMDKAKKKTIFVSSRSALLFTDPTCPAGRLPIIDAAASIMGSLPAGRPRAATGRGRAEQARKAFSRSVTYVLIAPPTLLNPGLTLKEENRTADGH
jgi:hypothetical protein